jgi:hypothetical protein
MHTGLAQLIPGYRPLRTGVSTTPGATAFTRLPCCAYSIPGLCGRRCRFLSLHFDAASGCLVPGIELGARIGAAEQEPEEGLAFRDAMPKPRNICGFRGRSRLPKRESRARSMLASRQWKIGRGLTAVVYVWVTVDKRDDVPGAIRHLISMQIGDYPEEMTIETLPLCKSGPGGGHHATPAWGPLGGRGRAAELEPPMRSIS